MSHTRTKTTRLEERQTVALRAYVEKNGIEAAVKRIGIQERTLHKAMAGVVMVSEHTAHSVRLWLEAEANIEML